MRIPRIRFEGRHTLTVYRKVQRYADPQTSKTPAQKEPDPDLGYDFIPKERYTSKEFMELEWERLWTKDENGQYNAFYNVCSHRGNQLLMDSGVM